MRCVVLLTGARASLAHLKSNFRYNLPMKAMVVAMADGYIGKTLDVSSHMHGHALDVVMLGVTLCCDVGLYCVRWSISPPAWSLWVTVPVHASTSSLS